MAWTSKTVVKTHDGRFVQELVEHWHDLTTLLAYVKYNGLSVSLTGDTTYPSVQVSPPLPQLA